VSPWTKGAAGSVGAALWIILVYGLPLAFKATKGEVIWTATKQTVLGLIGVLVFALLLGGAAPFLVDATSFKEALAEGLGWQGVFGQIMKFPSGGGDGGG